MLGVGLLAGGANVVMQLSRPGVGYGVVESRVESGRIDRHPIKRARTTFTYLAVSVERNPGAASGVPAGRERCACAGVLDRGKSGVLQRVRSRASDVGRRLHVQGRHGHLQALRRRDRRPGCRATVRGGHRARDDAAGASRDVACGPGGVRPLLGGVDGRGAPRRRSP